MIRQAQYLLLVSPAAVLWGSGAYELSFAFYLLVATALPLIALVRRRWQGHLALKPSANPPGRHTEAGSAVRKLEA